MAMTIREQRSSAINVGILPAGNFPKLFGVDYGINILVVAVLTVVAYIYLKYSKQGYEIYLHRLIRAVFPRE